MRKKTGARDRRIASRNSPNKLESLGAKKVILRPIDELRPFPGNPRQHSAAQLASLGRNMRRFGITQPLLIDESGTILAGHGRLEAAKQVGFQEVPTLTIPDLSATEKRTLVISDNRLSEQSTWNLDLLRKSFVEILNSDVDVELTGFTTGEINLHIDG